ncbi:MAG: 6-phosphogluconolactonase [Verrucomicrobiales bacterium]|nr:6-phosphogluconolactonase [Verrucomicrobiales bacterium]
MIELRQFSDSDSLATGAARRFLGALESRSPRPHPFTVALSGGRIATPFYDALVAQTGGRRALWENVEFFFTDERWVPLDHPDSNFQLARERLFEPLEIPLVRCHALAGGPDREFAAAQAQAELLARTPRSVQGQPILDLVILGMGEDGHVASLFPEASAEVVESRKVYLPVEGPKPPPERLTLTYAVLAEAREVWVLINGSGKEAALQESLCENGRTPLARVIRSRERTQLFTAVPVETGGDGRSQFRSPESGIRT